MNKFVEWLSSRFDAFDALFQAWALTRPTWMGLTVMFVIIGLMFMFFWFIGQYETGRWCIRLVVCFYLGWKAGVWARNRRK